MLENYHDLYTGTLSVNLTKTWHMRQKQATITDFIDFNSDID